ncbi:MAG: TolC family protein [Spirochaetia bacterium]|jgi:outer membrane protein TolC
MPLSTVAALSVIVLATALFPLVPASAQESTVTLSLAQSVDAALAQGADSIVLQRNLDIGREQYRLSVSQNSFTLRGSLGESATYGFGNSGLLAGSSLPSGFAQTPQAGLSLAAPLTSVALSVSPYVAESPLAAALPSFSSFLPSGPTSNVGLSLSQTLWSGYPGGTARAAMEKSLLALRGRELSSASGRLNIVSTLTQTYFVMLGSQRNLSVKKQILAQQEALKAQISAIHELRQASDVDLRSAQINAESAAIDVRSAENDLRIARIRLAQLIGWPRDREFAVAEEDVRNIPAGSVEEAVAEALKRRTEIRQIELNRQSAAVDRALIEGQTSPTVSVSGGISLILGWQGDTAGQGSAGVTIGLPILDAGASAHQREANRIQDQIYGVQEAQLRAGIATDVEQAYALMQINLERLEVAKLTAEKFDLKFKLKKTEAQYGAATNQDLLDASVDTANAQSALAGAQRDAQLAVLQLSNAIGY